MIGQPQLLPCTSGCGRLSGGMLIELECDISEDHKRNIAESVEYGELIRVFKIKGGGGFSPSFDEHDKINTDILPCACIF